jgi:UDP-N-acetylglucosamine acyltransferase
MTSTRIDPRAVLHPGAKLGVNVSIGPHAIVEEDVVVGDGTVIAGNAYIANGARIGKECRIHHGAVIANAPQDLKYANEPTTCELGDRTTVREYATLHRGTHETGRTVIGDDCFFMAYSHIAHDCRVGSRVIMANCAALAGHVHVEDFVIIGGLTPIHQFVRLGRHAMVGGGTAIGKDVPPFSLIGNRPAVWEGLNSIGLRRRGFSPEVLDALDRAYLLVYRSGLNTTQALERIRADQQLMSVVEVRIVVDFIASSKRGIVPAPRMRH